VRGIMVEQRRKERPMTASNDAASIDGRISVILITNIGQGLSTDMDLWTTDC